MVSLIAAGYLLLLAVKTVLALTYTRRYPAPGANARTGEVTVLQPILSGDPGLARVLEDNLQQLPEATFFWLVDQDDRSAQEITGRLAAQYPAKPIHLRVLPAAPEGVNPKLFKLEAAWREAPTAVCLVLDDDTRLPQHSLQALVEALDEVELSTGLPHYRSHGNFPSRLLAEFVNDNAALTYLPLLMFEPPITINGMCYALKRETLHDLGGFEPLLKHLTDDLAIARLVRQRGGRLRQTPYPQEVETQLRDTPHYVQQMHRWFLFATLLVRSEPPASALRIGLLQGLHPLLLWATCLGILLQPSPLAVGSLGVLLAIRAAVICGLQQRFTGRVQFNLFLSLLSELLQPLHLLHAACVRSIRWRSRRYRVYDNDRFESR